jgi:hypothetical protein
MTPACGVGSVVAPLALQQRGASGLDLERAHGRRSLDVAVGDVPVVVAGLRSEYPGPSQPCPGDFLHDAHLRARWRAPFDCPSDVPVTPTSSFKGVGLFADTPVVRIMDEA